MADPIEIPSIEDLIEKSYDNTQKSEQIHIQDALLTFAHVTETNATLLGTKLDELSTLLGTKFDEINANQTIIADLLATKLENMTLKLEAKFSQLNTSLNTKADQANTTHINVESQMKALVTSKMDLLIAEVVKLSSSLNVELKSTRSAMMSVFAGVDTTEDYNAVLAAIDTEDYQSIIDSINKGSILYTVLTSSLDFEELDKATVVI